MNTHNKIKAHVPPQIISQEITAAILAAFKRNPDLTTLAIAEMLDISPRTVSRHLACLKKMGAIRHAGPMHGGRWDVMR